MVLPAALAVDLRHVATLYRLWFGPKAPYPRENVEANLSEDELARARRGIKQIRLLMNMASGNAVNPAVASGAALDPEAAKVVVAHPNSVRKRIRGTGMRCLMGSHWASVETATVSVNARETASLIQDGAQEWLGFFCLSRLVAVIGGVADEPEWFMAAREIRKRMLARHHRCISGLLRLIQQPEHAMAVDAFAGDGGHEINMGRYPQIEGRLLANGLLPCLRTLTVRWWDELFRADGEAVTELAEDLAHGVFWRSPGEPLGDLFKRIEDAGLCERTAWQRPVPADKRTKGIGGARAWLSVIGVRSVYGHADVKGSQELYLPSGVLLKIVDTVLLACTRSVLWALFEVHDEMADLGDEEPLGSTSATARLLARLEKSAPYNVVKANKSTVTVSSFCHYPAGVPRWGKYDPAHAAKAKVILRRLEVALREVATERRAMVLALSEGR